MKQSIFFLLWMLGAVALSARSAPSVTIELRPEVRAAAPAVTLGQVAVLESGDLALLRQLVDLPVARAPAAGSSAVLEREALAGWLRRRLGLAPEQVEWSGPAASRVLSSSRWVDGDQIATVASQALQQWLATRSVRSEMHLVSTPRDVEATTGELRLQPRTLGRAALRNRVTVWVEVWVADRFLRVIPVTFAVSAWGEGMTALLPLAAGEPLTSAASAWGEVDLLAQGGTPIVTAQGLRARRAVAPGAMLRREDVEPVPAVQRGEWASLHAGAGAVRTEVRVQVLQDGRVGDSVRVRALAAAASLLARVTGAGQLEVAR